MSARCTKAARPRETVCVAVRDTRLRQAIGAAMWGDPIGARAAAEECRGLADALGDRSTSWSSRIWLGNALYFLGGLNEAGRVFLRLVEETATTGELFMTFFANVMLGRVRAYQGQPGPARACGETALAAATATGGFQEDVAYAHARRGRPGCWRRARGQGGV